MARPCGGTEGLESIIVGRLAGCGLEPVLVCRDRERRKVCQLLCPPERIVEIAETMNGTVSMQLRGRVDTDAEQHVPSHRPTELARETLDGPLVDGKAQLRCRNSEPTVRCGDAQIACHRQLGACTERGSVDRRHRDARQLGEAPQRAGQGPGELVVFDPGEIRSGAEGGWRTGEHHHPSPLRDLLLCPGQHHEGLVVHRIAPGRTVDGDDGDVLATPFETNGCLFRVGRLYHLDDCMAFEPNASDSAPTAGEPNDAVRARRRQVAKYTLLANRIGYLLYALAISCFVIAFAVGFSGFIVTLVTISLVAGSVLLAPSIVLGYAVKAAEREDRENGL